MSDLKLEIEKLERRLGLNQVSRPKPQALVVDDDRDIRASVYDVLSGLFEIKLCQDGEKALSCCTSKTKVALLDIKIQGKNGLLIFDELKKVYPDIPIIFLPPFLTTPKPTSGPKSWAHFRSWKRKNLIAYSTLVDEILCTHI